MNDTSQCWICGAPKSSCQGIHGVTEAEAKRNDPVWGGSAVGIGERVYLGGWPPALRIEKVYHS